MCGIAGLISKNDSVVRVKAMTETLRHRGPDASGIWYNKDQTVSLGHRRLSIIDLSEAGSQPMCDKEGRVALVFNGEIYNHQALREELEEKGVTFKGHSDTEVLLQAYLCWGSDAFSKISGMFAIGIIDRTLSKLLLVRDRCGQKPLYYIKENNEFGFASEIKSLFNAGMTNRRLSAEALHEYLAYGYTLGPETLVEGVKKVIPGEILYVSLKDLEVRKQIYWSPPKLTKYEISIEDAVLELEKLLEDAVRRHLIADVPVGIMLSGGLDSSLVTAMAAKVCDSTVKTFTAIFPGYNLFDESFYAKSISEFLGTEHFEIEIEKSSPEVMVTLARQFDEPIADHAIVPTYLLSKCIRKQAIVALGGDGGDELFGGYPHHQWIQRQAVLRRYMPLSIRNAVSWAAERWLKIGTKGRNHIIGLREKSGQGVDHVNLYFDSYSRARLLNEKDQNDNPEKRKTAIAELGETLLDQMLISDFKTTLAEGYLMKVDRASMLTSLEVRSPWLDDTIIEFALGRVPSNYKATFDQKKIIPSRLAEKLLPKSMDTTRKQGLTMPLSTWMNGEWGRFLGDVMLDSSQDLFSKFYVDTLFQAHKKGFNNQDRIFALAMLRLWSREYKLSR